MASPADVGKLVVVRPDLSSQEQHLTVKAGEDVDYLSMPKASRQRPSVLLYLHKAGYDIKLVKSNDFMWAMSQVKWSTPNPSGVTAVDLLEVPTAYILRHMVKDL
ncbi:La-related protein 6 [Hordeum vulgare]|nr:La-related protein 6 [Hordeum vulgare]